ncbi:MAG TPA: hypothetical protein VFN64_11270 [Burkholderiaceae bacterium]|nr:hypothetical protein [Burkholderiaceae bacterium]
MHLTLLLPGALLPREVVRALAEPLAATGLAFALTRAHLVGDSDADAGSPPHLAWLADHLFQREAPLATAPYAYADLAGHAPAADQFLWHADAVHLELARDHLMLTPLAPSPTDDEAGALLAAANALAANAGVEIVRKGDHWFLRAPHPWELDAKPLAATIGRPLPAVLPAGRDAATWSRLLTEIQMTWHAHPVNEAREARGAPTVNSVWLHGGGHWASLARPDYSSVFADEPEWRGAAQAAGIAASPADAAPGDNALVVWTDLLAPRLLQDWTGWIAALRALDQRWAPLARSNAVDFVLTGEAALRRLRSHPSDRLKFWRAGSLDQVLSE